MDGFTLTEFAFPVAPANLTGFTIQGFAWVGGPEPASTVGALVCGIPALAPRINGTVGMTVRVYGTADLREC